MANIMDLFSKVDVVDVGFDISKAKGIYERIKKAQDTVGGRPRIIAKVGSGGIKVFQLSNGNREIVMDKLQGIIIAHHKNNALFPVSESDEVKMNKPPICASLDGITGIIQETGECRDCATCPHNVFGTAGKGKECKNMHRLYILVEGCPIPVTLSLPPTSLELWSNYAVMDVAAAGFDLSDVVTEFTLTSAENATGQKYSIVNFKMVGKVDEEVKQFCTDIGSVLEQAPRLAIEGDEYNVEPTVIEQDDTAEMSQIPSNDEPDDELPKWAQNGGEDEPKKVDFDEL